MLHVSGAGGSPKYGVVPQMPLTTLDGVNLMDNLTYMQPRVGNDSASIGRYTTNLANGVRVDFTASMHAGLINYLFPENGNKYILVDLSHFLPTQDDHASSQHYSNGRLDISGNGANYSGYGIWRGGWGQGRVLVPVQLWVANLIGPDYTVYFCAQFDNAPESYRLLRGPYTGASFRLAMASSCFECLLGWYVLTCRERSLLA